MGDIIDQEACNTTLGLGISLDDFVPKRDHHQQQQQKKNRSKPVVFFDLSFPFHFKDEQEMEIDHNTEGSSSKTSMNGEEERQISVSNNNGINNGGVRKKLRLTKEQSTFLENSFKQHSTPNMTQKQALAEKLNLKPRQVEVWFQNRRARTKLKQTEVDCEFLKKCCENLRNENRRLKREVQELRSSFKNINKTAAKTTLSSEDSKPLFRQLRKANAATTMYSVCPSCQKMMISFQGDATGGGTDDIAKG